MRPFFFGKSGVATPGEEFAASCVADLFLDTGACGAGIGAGSVVTERDVGGGSV